MGKEEETKVHVETLDKVSSLGEFWELVHTAHEHSCKMCCFDGASQLKSKLSAPK